LAAARDYWQEVETWGGEIWQMRGIPTLTVFTQINFNDCVTTELND